MQWSASVLTAPSADTDPSISVSFGDAKYVFNVPEATKRATLQNKHSWRKTRAVFLSNVGLDRAGGMAGLLMSMADSELPQLDVMGPEGTLHYIAAMRLYTYRTNFAVYATELSSTPDISATPNPVYKDECASIYALPVSPSATEPDRTASTSLKRKHDDSMDISVERSQKALTGDAAQGFRRRLIRSMFPDSKEERQNAASKAQKKKENWEAKQKEKEKAARDVANQDENQATQANLGDDEYRRRVRPPQGFFSQLPTYEGPSPTMQTMSYVVLGPRVRGKFDAQKAKALGVPSGPLRGRLAKGETITVPASDDGTRPARIVRPEEIVAPAEAPSAVLVLDLPTVDHARALARQFQESTFYSRLLHPKAEEKDRDYLVRAVFHLAGPGVLECPEYQDLVTAFGQDVQHVIASSAHAANPVTFTSYASTLLKLNALDSRIFPIPKFSMSSPAALPALTGLPPSNVHSVVSSLSVPIRPYGTPSIEAVSQDKFHPKLQDGAEIISASTRKMFNEAQAAVAAYTPSTDFPGADVEVTTLGTGSALPTKYRNVLSNLIRIPGWGAILLDCGEGTWGQLARQLGVQGAEDVLRELKCIFVSHVHGDHHMGLAKVLWKRRLLMEREAEEERPKHPLYLVTIRGVHLYLREFSDLYDLQLVDARHAAKAGPGDVVTVMNEALHWKAHPSYVQAGTWAIGGDEMWTDIEESRSAARLMCESLGLSAFQTIDVWHRTKCYGCQVKHKDGWSIVFSGDTAPADPLVFAGQGATLLIHEASMADDQKDLARQKAHSTVGQALTISRRMHAKHVLLTHFSARYPKMPPVQNFAPLSGAEKDEDGSAQVVALAFDHATMRIGDMWKMQIYMPAIDQAFYEMKVEDPDSEDEEMDASKAVEVNVT